jgi:hypothetical protein
VRSRVARSVYSTCGASVLGAQRAAELPVRADDEDLLRRDRGHLREARVVLVLLTDLDLGRGDRPVDRGGLVGEVEERVLGIGDQWSLTRYVYAVSGSRVW